MARKKSETVSAVQAMRVDHAQWPADHSRPTGLDPGPLTHHFAAIGMARVLDRCVPGSTTSFGPDANVDCGLIAPPGLRLWCVDDPDRIDRYREHLRGWTGRPLGTTGAIPPDRLLGMRPGNPEAEWLDAFAAEGHAACWLGPMGIGPDDGRGPYLPILRYRGEAGWAIALPYWDRRHWGQLEVVLRGADLYQGPEVGDGAANRRSWAVYPVAPEPAVTLPERGIM